jgi:hypothetical protein
MLSLMFISFIVDSQLVQRLYHCLWIELLCDVISSQSYKLFLSFYLHLMQVWNSMYFCVVLLIWGMAPSKPLVNFKF